MRTFKEFYEGGETHEVVALMPGGFKPPHRGHFKAFKYLLQDADRGIVMIGHAERDGITAEQSKAIWEIYAKYAGKPVEVVIIKEKPEGAGSPVIATYDYANANKDIKIIVGAGDFDDGKGKRDDARYNYFKNNVEKYPLVNVVTIPPQEDSIKGKIVRPLISKDIDEAIDYFAPRDLLSETDKDAIKSILTA
jgi:hypothetical protein